ncbi:amino acid permease 3-like [Hordeum vulgare subsp. vulgare]|uniref:Amino acid transporter transmembrane domain-containing protein n=1 Tax=Hordeum vulgare subsp. vulgare TaxID=112509 RepID=A0A8I6WRS6_HORVV|nr:amino acid permease 3-like [Hordeum vulgare subsp. vulgare]
MSHAMAPVDMRRLETGAGGGYDGMGLSKRVDDDLDDDGRPRRTGTAWTASAHIITTVLGSGVLSLAWGVAQLGWVAGPGVMTLFAAVIYYTSALLADCYRAGDPVTGPRNRTYMAAVRATLGGSKVKLCGAIQFVNLFGIGIGITIAASVSMLAIKKAGCFHKEGHKGDCNGSSMSPYIAIYGIMEIFFSQIPGLDSMWWLSTLATVMSFTYSTIGISLGVAQIVANGGIQGGITGVAVGINAAGQSITMMQKVWHSLQAFGNMAFAYGFSIVLLEIQDTLKAAAPSEAKVMKKATAVSVAVTTVIYLLCGCVGYAAFGDGAPDNLLTGFGFYEPFWLLDVANAAVTVHLVGTYQVITQPIFAYVELRAAAAWPDSAFVGTREVRLWPSAVRVSVCPLRLTWRTAYVCVTTAVAMAMPFFGSVVGLIGSISFWPLTVYFPVEMYIAQRRVPRGSTRWLFLQALSAVCLLVSLVAAAGSVADVAAEFKAHNPFRRA